MSRIACTAACALACACGGGTSTQSAEAPAAPASPAPARTTAPPTVAPGPPPLPSGPDLSPLAPAPSALSAPVIVSPPSGAHLAGETAADTQVVLGRAESLPDAASLGLVLDDFRIRYVGRQETLALGDLVPANRELGPGTHRLVVVTRQPDGALSRSADGTVISVSSEFVVATASSDPGPLVYLEPQGTYNGPAAAERARLEFLAPGAGPGERIEVRIAGNGGLTAAEILPSHAYAIGGLESGDYRVTLVLLGEAGSPRQTLSRTITVNLDAPLPR